MRALSDEKLLRFLARAYRVLLFVYAEPFRRAYQDELTEIFRARAARHLSEGRPFALVVLLLRSVLDVVSNGAGDRLSRWRASRSGPTDPGESLRPARSPRPAGDPPVLAIVQNARFALRTFVRQPALSATLILTLSIGTGATTALFAVVDAALLRPLPYPRADRLVSVHRDDPALGRVPFAPPLLSELREHVSTVEGLAGFSSSWELTLTELGEPRRVTAAFVSDGLFQLLGVNPFAGRDFDALEHAPGGPRAVIVSRPFWERHFGTGIPLSGQMLRLDGETHTIVGIASAFRLPITSSLVSQRGAPAELWLPFALNPYANLRVVPVMNVIGRLAAGASVDQAAAELDAVGRSLDSQEQSPGVETTAVRLQDLVTRDARGVVLTLFGAAGFLLLIACINVANLLLSRASTRGHELAVRRALGAGRRQIFAQMLVESAVLAAVGCALGLLLAWSLIRAVAESELFSLPPSADIGVNFRLVLFVGALTLFTTGVFGLLPALQASRQAPEERLRTGARSSEPGRRARNALVTAEVALSVTLLVGAALLARSFWTLVNVDPGFRAENLLQVPVPLDGGGNDTGESRIAFLTELSSALSRLPGVDHVAAVNRLPLGGGNVFVGVEVEGMPQPEGGPPLLDRRVATPGYFSVMGTEIASGREFTDEDGTSTTPVAIVNEALARRFWPGESGVGRRARLMLRSGPGPWLTVVGVVEDVRHHGLDRPVEPEIYVPYAQAPVESMTFLLRTGVDPASLVGAARRAVWDIDDELPLDGTSPVTEIVSGSVVDQRVRALVLNGFALIALVLAAIGIYGVVSYSVAHRTRDIGVRLALGAPRLEVLRQFVGEGLLFSAAGVLLGLGGAWLLRRTLSSFLFGVEPMDPATLASVSLLLALVAVAVSYVPARRAARVDPVRVLRGE
jgi:putative ABC transport system permease protein